MIALFGGTFNPVHNGHISLAREVTKHFTLDSVEFLPSFLPVHRDEPETSASIRKQMVKLAIQPYAELELNISEIDRAGPSYTVDTLRAIKASSPQQSVIWLMGADSFNSFSSWKNPVEILKLSHLIVCARPAVKLDTSRFAEHVIQPDESLKSFQAGKIAFYTMRPNDCSSTDIRKTLKAGLPVSGCLPESVLEFVRHMHLYET